MELIPLIDLPKLHITPLGSVKIENAAVTLWADDENKKRFKFECKPYQASRMITEDCFSLPEDLHVPPQQIVEVLNSKWISELKNTLIESDETATFMNKARHFIFSLQDDYLEVVAWDIKFSEESM